MEHDPLEQAIRTLIQAQAGKDGDVILDMASGTFMFTYPDGTFKISRVTEPETDNELEGEPSSDDDCL